MTRLFREFFLTERRDRFHGEVRIFTPLSWLVVTFLILFLVVGVILFLTFATFSTTVVADGVIATQSGIAEIVPLKSGILTEVHVVDGQLVQVGDDLASVSTGEDITESAAKISQVERAISEQGLSLKIQAKEDQSAIEAQVSKIYAQRSGFDAEVTQIQAQISYQNALVNSAQQDLERARLVAERGFISNRDILVREETLAGRQLTLGRLRQELSSKQTLITEANRALTQLAAERRAKAAGMNAAIAAVAQVSASNKASRRFVVRSPISGRVTALVARVGQPVNTNIQLMSIIPIEAPLHAELNVPTSSIGFIKVGNEVSVAVDAFPFQRFGTLKGKVIRVASATVGSPMQQHQNERMFPISVTLASEGVLAHGKLEALRPGMSLTARISTDRQSLYEFLFSNLLTAKEL